VQALTVEPTAKPFSLEEEEEEPEVLVSRFRR
jgi:hypothetical protein